MKSILITYDQAHHEAILDALDRTGCRGFTSLGTVQGRGSRRGEPHYGTHAWPALASAIITVVEDDRVDPLLARLRTLDEAKPRLGLRAFVWAVEATL